MVRRTSNKLLSGITLAVVKRLIARDATEYYEQNPTELYAILDVQGWRFHTDRKMWVERKYQKRRPPTVQIMKTPVPATAQETKRGIVALMRVIAPANELDYILSQINELIPCLDGEITTQSKRYPGQNAWERVYLRIVFNRRQTND
jgi:hypothetical protein